MNLSEFTSSLEGLYVNDALLAVSREEGLTASQKFAALTSYALKVSGMTVKDFSERVGVSRQTLHEYRSAIKEMSGIDAGVAVEITNVVGSSVNDFIAATNSEFSPKEKALADPRVVRAIELLQSYINLDAPKFASMEYFIDLVKSWMESSGRLPSEVAKRVGLTLSDMDKLLEGEDPGLTRNNVALLLSTFDKTSEFRVSDFIDPDSDEGPSDVVSDRPRFPQRNGHGKS